MHNAIKHSGVKRFEVRIQEQSGEIHLIVADSGKGFNLEEALQSTGLGLASMRERVRLVNGTITINAKPMGGNIIDVRVPLSSNGDARRVAG